MANFTDALNQIRRGALNQNQNQYFDPNTGILGSPSGLPIPAQPRQPLQPLQPLPQEDRIRAIREKAMQDNAVASQEAVNYTPDSWRNFQLTNDPNMLKQIQYGRNSEEVERRLQDYKQLMQNQMIDAYEQPYDPSDYTADNQSIYNPETGEMIEQDKYVEPNTAADELRTRLGMGNPRF